MKDRSFFFGMEMDERVFNKDYAKQTLSRTRKVIGGAALSTVSFWFTIWSFWDWQIASITVMLPITFFGLMLSHMGDYGEINFIEKIFGDHQWLLWRAHFIDHERMPEDESQALIHDPSRIIRVGDYVHVAKSQKDLMIFKLSIGDYL